MTLNNEDRFEIYRGLTQAPRTLKPLKPRARLNRFSYEKEKKVRELEEIDAEKTQAFFKDLYRNCKD